MVVAGEIGLGPLSVLKPVIQPGEPVGLSAFSPASEDLHRATVVRAGGERATDRELDACDRQLAVVRLWPPGMPVIGYSLALLTPEERNGF